MTTTDQAERTPELPLFDLRALGDAIETRDAEYQIPLYADDAIVQVIDPDNPPRSPRVIRGQPAIASWIRDICHLRMTHRMVALVDAGETAAFTEEGRYKDGGTVVSASTVEIRRGLIVHQRVISVWDDLDWR